MIHIVFAETLPNEEDNSTSDDEDEEDDDVSIYFNNTNCQFHSHANK